MLVLAPRSFVSSVGPDGALRLYVYPLIATHLVVLSFFLDSGILDTLTKAVEPVCWPYFENCWQFRFEGRESIAWIGTAYFLLIATAVVARLYERPRSLWWSLAALNVALAIILSLDYRLRSSESYMLLWVNWVALLWPGKRWAISLIIVSFYVWAGVLKLNYEWLSGSVLYKPLFLIPDHFVWLACTYVVVLETLLIWGLLAGRRWLLVVTLCQLLLFHVQSFSQIHWFYPFLMFCILAWFCLPNTRPAFSPLSDFLRFRAPSSTYALCALFGVAQLAPSFYSGDSTLTGQGRIFALDMFEARQQCTVQAVLRLTGGDTIHVDLVWRHLPARKICDPIIYFNRAQNICRTRPDLIDLELTMKAKRTTDPTWTPIIQQAEFCSQHHEYRVLRNNEWIHKR